MATGGRVEHRDGMTIVWDAPLLMDDGVVLRADVFRPEGDGTHPVILSYGPYADAALAAGLADAVHPAEELLDAALALAGRIAERPWRALKLTKLALRAHRPATTAFDVAAQALLFEGEDKRERMRAFLAERDRRRAERGRP